MSEENDVKLEESQASEVQEEATTEAETKEEATQSDVDYQKELEKAKQELEKKTKQVSQAEHVIENLKKGGNDNIEDVVARLVDEKVSALTEQVRGDAIDSLISAQASSQDEAELIKFHLQNSIKPSGDDVTDIINAKALANKARFSQQSAEIKRAQSTSEADKVTTAGQKPSKDSSPKFTAEEQKIMRQYGLTPEDVLNGVR